MTHCPPCSCTVPRRCILCVKRSNPHMQRNHMQPSGMASAGPGKVPHNVCRFSGQLNRTDFFPRFLFGIANTGLAPDSFYGLPHGPDEHFDGTPVDVAAAGIVGLAVNERSGFDTYHVVNDHWHDGISLDRVVDWISTAGIQVSAPPAARLCPPCLPALGEPCMCLPLPAVLALLLQAGGLSLQRCASLSAACPLTWAFLPL